MKKLALMLCGIVLAGQAAFAGSIGIGYGASTELYKSDEKGYVLPMVDLEYENFFIKGATVNGFSFGYNLYQDDFYTLSLYVKPFGGYKMDADDMKHGYRNIDDREHKVMGGAEVTVYTGIYDIEMLASVDYGKEGGNILFQLNRPYFVNSKEHKVMGGAEVTVYTGIYDIEMLASVDYGKEGGNILFQLNRPYFVNSKFTLIPSANFVYFNSDYIDYYFGVSHSEVLKNSGIDRSYEGDSAYTIGLNLTGSYRITDSFSLMGFAGVNRVSKEIKNSPIVDDDIIYFVGTGVVYTF